MEKSSLMVQLAAQRLNGDLIDRVRSQQDFMGDDYRAIQSDLTESLNHNQDKWNNGYYFALYRDIGGVLCGFMYLSGEIGPVYPSMGWYEEEDSVPSQAFQGAIVSETDTDESGTWIYSMGPVKNSTGEIVAILEIGTALYSFEQENARLIQSTLLDVITMLIVLVLAFIETMYLTELLARKKAATLSGNAAVFSHASFARPFSFIFSLAIGISVAFVPIMMKNLYTEFLHSGGDPLLGLPADVAIALPISIEMLFFGIALAMGGFFIRRVGWRPILLAGIIAAMTGLFLSAESADVYLFLISRGVVGFGSGFVLLTTRRIINFEKDPITKSGAYSNYYSGTLAGVTVGAVFGGFFAEHLGFSNVFYMAFCIGIAALVFAYTIFIRNKEIINKEEQAARKKLQVFEVFKFIFHPQILVYFLLIIVPTYAAGMFLSYYLPLFAESEGLALSDIGRLFMIHGLIVIYLGPIVSLLAKKKFRNEKQALIVGSLGWAVSLVIFAATGNIWGVVFTLVIMAVTEGFCVVAQNDYFLDLKIVKEIGEDIAVSYFEIAAKIAEIIAPMIFGWVLLMGATSGMWAFGLAILAATFVFSLLSKIKGRE
jgi:predicted MFS family arabinose efflux permease